jgi:hypothetical protein
MITLLVGYYQDPDPRRAAEFVECLRRNIANPYIEQVHVFDETRTQDLASKVPVLASPKVVIVPSAARMRFTDFFSYANNSLRGKTVATANTDIFFDETLELLGNYQLCGRLLALTPWDVLADGSRKFRNLTCSQDAWIFSSPIPVFPVDWFLGVLGADERLAYEANRAGMVVTNPSLSIRASHLHLSGIRRYTAQSKLLGNYLRLPITDLAGNRLPPSIFSRENLVPIGIGVVSFALGAWLASTNDWGR